MIKENYKNYLIESNGLESAVDRRHAQKVSFKIKGGDKSTLFDFFISQMDFDTEAITEKDFISMCLKKVKEILDQESSLINHSFEYRGSVLVEIE